MKVMVVHHGTAVGQALTERIKALNVEVFEQKPSWPSYFFNAKEERPDVAVIDASEVPSHAREIAGYLGETGFTNRIRVFIVNMPEEERERTVWRAPNAKLVTLGQLEKLLAEMAEAS